MGANAELARIFDEMAAMLEISGANSFRVSAHARVARALNDLNVDVADLAGRPEELRAIEGIGESSARKILHYLETGTVEEHAKLLETIPHGLLEVLKIPGLGPKTVKMLWEKAGVTDLASLKAALDSGELEELPRLGPKSVANIKDALKFLESRGGRVRLGQALPIAEAIIEGLRAVPGAGARRVEYAGSLRRGRDTIGDIDIVAVADDPAALSEAFRRMHGVEKVLAAGSTKSSVRLAQGIQVDLRIVEDSSFGAALMYFSGSKEHNVLLRERAQKMGLRLNEYGLFPDDGVAQAPQERGVAPAASASEEEIYEALGLPWIPPELREARGEFDLAATPDLIEISDIKAELHAHTTASDGRLSLDQLIEAARSRGRKAIAVTDHSQASAQANGLTPDRLRAHVEAIRAAAAKHTDITILAGAEVDIHADGRLDYDDEILAMLDVVVASPHSALRQERDVATKRLLAAIRHPLVHIIAHPTGRVLNSREGLQPDIAAVSAAAAAARTALEVNSSSARLDLRDIHVKSAVDAGALVAIDTDVHAAADLDQLRYGVLTARRGWLTPDHCVNAWPVKKLLAWLRSKR